MYYFQFVANNKLPRDVFTAQQLILLSGIKTNSFYRMNSLLVVVGCATVVASKSSFYGHRLQCAHFNSLILPYERNGNLFIILSWLTNSRLWISFDSVQLLSPMLLLLLFFIHFIWLKILINLCAKCERWIHSADWWQSPSHGPIISNGNCGHVNERAIFLIVPIAS